MTRKKTEFLLQIGDILSSFVDSATDFLQVSYFLPIFLNFSLIFSGLFTFDEIGNINFWHFLPRLEMDSGLFSTKKLAKFSTKTYRINCRSYILPFDFDFTSIQEFLEAKSRDSSQNSRISSCQRMHWIFHFVHFSSLAYFMRVANISNLVSIHYSRLERKCFKHSLLEPTFDFFQFCLHFKINFAHWNQHNLRFTFVDLQNLLFVELNYFKFDVFEQFCTFGANFCVVYKHRGQIVSRQKSQYFGFFYDCYTFTFGRPNFKLRQNFNVPSKSWFCLFGDQLWINWVCLWPKSHFWQLSSQPSGSFDNINRFNLSIITSRAKSR